MAQETFETLIKSKKVAYEERWKPLIITKIEKEIACGCLAKIPTAIRKNIAYNLQYLEYLTFQVEELNLNSAILNSIYKNYVIIGSSIIEAIFFCIIKENNLCPKNDLELIFTTKANPIKHDEDNIVVETNVFRKVEPREVEMTYDAMIKKIESKKMLGINHKAYPYIKKFRQLRNRVHLQLSKNDLDTDWWSFSKYDYLLMKYILYIIIEDIQKGEIAESALYFLKLPFSDLNDLAHHLRKNK